ncbi:MAG TPA: NAD-dependent epimerase/dehydratase family protein [Jatrophihabitantaceae bacterium]
MATRDARVVLVSGAGRFLGARVAGALAADPTVDRIVGVDTAPPVLGQDERVEYIRADIAHHLIGTVLEQARVSAVVHTGPSDHRTGLGSLLQSCERSRTVTRVVLASSSAVYGAARTDPAVCTESTRPASDLPPGAARNHLATETMARELARRRPDLTITVLRLAPVLGPSGGGRLARYLTLPLVPVALGFDPRVQVVHEADAVAVLAAAARAERSGIVNVAGPGVLTVGQLVRRAGRLPVPVLAPALRLTGLDAGWLTHGRVLDTLALGTRFGYQPRFSTEQAVAAFAAARASRVRLAPALLSAAERAVTGNAG